MDLINAHLEDEKFGVDDIARALNLSRSQLHRKVNHLTGMPASRLIRKIKLDKAKELLENGDLTVSEVAYRVGFGSPSYFIKSYHDYFGNPPGNVQKKNIIRLRQSEIMSRILGKKEGRKPNRRNLWVLALLAGLISIFFIVVPIGKGAGTEKSIAILPFINLSGDLGNQYMVDGVQDMITAHLSKLSGLRVIPRLSSEQYRKTNKTPKAIGTELQVGYLVEGSFQKVNDEVKIHIWLIDARKESQEWFREYDREWKDIFKIQSDIAGDIAGEMNIIVSQSSKKLMTEIPTENLKAYDFYLQAREEFMHWFRDQNNSHLDNAIVLYKKAIDLDPGYAAAYSGLAFAINNKFYDNPDYKNICGDTILLLTDKALSLNDKLEEVYLVRSLYYTNAVHDNKKAYNDLVRVLEINPNYAPAYYGKGINELEFFGNPLGGIKDISKAIRLEYGLWKPLYYRWLGHAYYDAGFEKQSVESFNNAFALDNDTSEHYLNMAEIYIGLGDLKKAEPWNLICIEVHPEEPFFYWRSVLIYNMTADCEKATESLQKYFETKGHYDSLSIFTSYTLWCAGREEEARKLFAMQLKDRESNIITNDNIDESWYSYFDLTAINAFLGNKDKSLEYIKAWNDKKYFTPYDLNLIRTCPLLNSIRTEKSFTQAAQSAELKFRKEHEKVGRWISENNK